MKGLFKPKNPEKYLGDINKIRFLSSWEFKFMEKCDRHPDILQWGSEEIRIPYFNPIKQKVTNYIPDFIIKYKDKNNIIITEVIEIKPKKQSEISKNMNTYDKVQLVINNAKWTAAKLFCEQHKIKFRVLTENDMFK